MPRLDQDGRVVIFDKTARPSVLPAMWTLGSILHGGTSYGVTSWGEAFAALGGHPHPIRELQVWSHGDNRGPAIAKDVLRARELPALADVLPDVDLVWWRSCSVAKNQVWMMSCVIALGCVVAAHTRPTNSPNPLTQRGLVALEPGETPSWHPMWDGATCSTLRMRFPAKLARRWTRAVHRGG